MKQKKLREGHRGVEHEDHHIQAEQGHQDDALGDSCFQEPFHGLSLAVSTSHKSKGQTSTHPENGPGAHPQVCEDYQNVDEAHRHDFLCLFRIQFKHVVIH